MVKFLVGLAVKISIFSIIVWFIGDYNLKEVLVLSSAVSIVLIGEHLVKKLLQDKEETTKRDCF